MTDSLDFFSWLMKYRVLKQDLFFHKLSFFFYHIRPGIEIYLKETPLIQDNKNTEGDGGFCSWIHCELWIVSKWIAPVTPFLFSFRFFDHCFFFLFKFVLLRCLFLLLKFVIYFLETIFEKKNKYSDLFGKSERTEKASCTRQWMRMVTMIGWRVRYHPRSKGGRLSWFR
jgi:hypothetical protein